MASDRRREWLWLASFAGVFAILAAFVFWGTWSSDFAPVMPDDSVVHPLSYAEQFLGGFRGMLAGCHFHPLVFFWNGMLPQYGVQELKYVVGLFGAALGLAVFLRERGLSRPASYGAGLLLGFCGYWTTLFSAGHGGWFIIMSYVVFAFVFADRVAKHGRIADGIVLGAFVGWGAGPQQDLFLLFSVFLAVYGVYACLRERTFHWKAALVAFAFFSMVGAPGIHNAFTESLAGRDKQIEESKGTALSGGAQTKSDDEARWIFVTNWSMPPEDTLEFFIHGVHGDTSCPMTLQLSRAAGKDIRPYTGRLGRPINATAGNYRQHSLYVGWVTCLLALFAIAWAGRKVAKRETADGNRRTADIAFFVIVALVFWLFSLGRFCEPIYRLVYALPFGDYMRAPVKWHHLTEFCLCILAGFGLEAIFVFLKEKGLGGGRAVAIVAAIAVFGAADLARNDRLFCAPIDLRLVTGKNAVADDITRLGRGTVCDFVGGAQGLLGWSFQSHGVGANRDLNAPDTRFVLVGNEQLKRTPQLSSWLTKKATPVGTYVLGQDCIRRTAPHTSNLSLFQVNGVPPPPPAQTDPQPKADWFLRLLGLASLLGSLAGFGCLALRLRR